MNILKHLKESVKNVENLGESVRICEHVRVKSAKEDVTCSNGAYSDTSIAGRSKRRLFGKCCGYAKVKLICFPPEVGLKSSLENDLSLIRDSSDVRGNRSHIQLHPQRLQDELRQHVALWG